MHAVFSLTKRNIKLFFKDKGMFFSSLITPVILLVLYATFLKNVYRDSFLSSLPQGFAVDDSIIDGCVGGILFSSLLAVCTVTVSFCANLFMVQDKVTGARKDFNISPIKSSQLSLSYYFSTAINALIICIVAMAISLIYIAKVGWYYDISDILYILLDTVLLVLFGTALSSIVCFPLKTQGQMSAVGTLVSAGYGFICGAYMPISQFSETLQKILSFLPGTYATSLIKNHALGGVLAEMESIGFPAEVITAMQDSFDGNIYFFGSLVTVPQKYIVLCSTIAVLMILYIILNAAAAKK